MSITSLDVWTILEDCHYFFGNCMGFSIRTQTNGICTRFWTNQKPNKCFHSVALQPWVEVYLIKSAKVSWIDSVRRLHSSTAAWFPSSPTPLPDLLLFRCPWSRQTQQTSYLSGSRAHPTSRPRLLYNPSRQRRLNLERYPAHLRHQITWRWRVLLR